MSMLIHAYEESVELDASLILVAEAHSFMAKPSLRKRSSTRVYACSSCVLRMPCQNEARARVPAF
jgi:hypothetical protein